MASLQKQYSNIKLQGVVYTPTWVVDCILDSVGYTGSDILGKTVLDPACGDGRFLIQVVKRILTFSKPAQRLQNVQCVYGWDIDCLAVQACKRNLDMLVAEYGLAVNWNITVQNALHTHNNNDLWVSDIQQFDFIVGNPPYIRIQHLDTENRKLVKQRFSFCQSGSTDIYMAFFELAFGLLKDMGICGFITPNSYLRTNTARNMRDFFAKTQAIKHIHNFGAVQIFEGFSAYTAITIFSKQKHTDIKVYKYHNKNSYNKKTVAYEQLQNQLFWDFSDNMVTQGTKLKDIANIFTGLATLADKVYVSEYISKNKNIVTLKNKVFGIVHLEKDILRPVIKASRYKQDNQPITEYILFPYTLANGRADIIPENILKNTYPLAYTYLCTARDILDRRDAGKPNKVAWYAYGRSQGLTNCMGKKIIFSPMAKHPAFYICDNENALIYSGYGMKTNIDFKKIKQCLMSDRLKIYIHENGADFAGNWKGYNKTILQEFIIDEDI